MSDRQSENDNADTDRRQYQDAEDQFLSARKAAAARLLASPTDLLAWLTQEPLTLRDRVGLTVRWGLARKLVKFDRERAVAYAQQDRADVAPHLVEAHLKELDLDVDEVEMLDERECIFATYEERRAYVDLKYALETGYGQAVALDALEDELGDRLAEEYTPVICPGYPVESVYALRLLPQIALIAEADTPRGIGIVEKSRSIPTLILDAFLPIAARMEQEELGANQPPWFLSLLWQFQRPLRGADAREAVHGLLSLLPELQPVPEPFRSRKPEHITRAIDFVRTNPIECVDDDDDYDHRPVYRAERPRRGRPLKPWVAASLFARCFDVALVPEREKDAKRRKT